MERPSAAMCNGKYSILVDSCHASIIFRMLWLLFKYAELTEAIR